MGKRPTFSIVAVTGFLLVYLVMLELNVSLDILLIMLGLAPLLLIWMVITILKYGVFRGPELKEHEEWGYGDKHREDLGLFW